MKRVPIYLTMLLALAAIAPAASNAKPKGKVKPATFKLEITGEQLTTWNYIKQQEPSCDFPEMASGTQYIDFETYVNGEIGPMKVKVSQAPGDTVGLKYLDEDATLLASENQAGTPAK